MAGLMSAKTKIELKTYGYLLQWLAVSVVAGVVGSVVIQFSLHLYRLITGFIWSVDSVPLFIWPAAGAAVVSFVVYRLEPGAKGEGLPSYISSLRDGNGNLPFRETVFKLVAAVLTLGTFGNGGFLGPCGRVTAGIMSMLRRLIPHRLISKEHSALFPICGLAAAFGALVHSSLGAGIFAVEIIQKSSMKYRHLFPAVLAASVSVYFCRLFGFEPVFHMNAALSHFNLAIAPVLILLSIAAGFTGRGFTDLYSLISRLFHRDLRMADSGTAFRAVIGSALAFIPLWLVNPFIVGTSEGIFDAVINGGRQILYGNLPDSVPLFWILLLLIVLKAAANSLTVGSGLSAGFAGPSMLIGLLAGAAFSELCGFHAGTPEYYAMLAAGFAGVFSSSMNTPIAVAVLTVELFGLHYGLPATLGAVIGFQLNRHHTLYDMVFEEETE